VKVAMYGIPWIWILRFLDEFDEFGDGLICHLEGIW
jgi:hypothetical protein